jgi:transcriptional regulator with XRE-family HTH domain
MAGSTAHDGEGSFGRRIQELRRKSGLTQRQVAEKLGIDFTYLSKLENNRGEPPGEQTIRGLAHLLKGNEEELLALAGKISIELREMASKDAEFAAFLRQLPKLSDSARQRLYKDVRAIRGRSRS